MSKTFSGRYEYDRGSLEDGQRAMSLPRIVGRAKRLVGAMGMTEDRLKMASWLFLFSWQALRYHPAKREQNI